MTIRSSVTQGIAEFIDFTGSGIAQSDDAKGPRQPIRMNTLFARELINRANIALENLLTWETQGLEEPPLQPPAAVNHMDFHGANGKYFWELFLHLPFLVSQRLNLELQFDESERWLGFIFDPSRKQDSGGRPNYWNVRPLVADTLQMDHATRKPADPDGIASSHPVHYRKAIYLHYLKNLLDRGDAAYRQLTPDSLGEAKLWYVRVLDLLGSRPDINLVNSWTPMTLQALSNSTNSQLRDFERRLIGQDQLRDDSAQANEGHSLYQFVEPPLYLRTFSPDPTLVALDSDHLRLPINTHLVRAWDIAESRLDNLRNNRTLDGKPLSLPLFAAPLNPRDLLAAYGQGAATGGSTRLLAQDVPHYRFRVMHERASNAVQTLIQFGSTLLSLIERKEQSQLQELQYQQAWEFAQFAIDLQLQAQRVDEESQKALLASQAIAQQRHKFYAQLSEEVVNAGEITAGSLHLAGRVAESVSAVANAVAGGVIIAPNAAGGVGGVVAGLANGVIAGAAMGGWRLEGIPKMVSAVAQGVAALSHGAAEAADRTEQFRRRHQEWKLARDQAALEIEQIDAQLQLLAAQSLATDLQLRQTQAAQAHTLATYAFLGSRFSNTQLYQWLNGQFATFYYQAYDATLSLCLAAEASWQFEIADYTSRFIQTGAWNDSYRGLGAGEALKLQLLKMDAAYLSRNERHLEITKTVSLRQLPEKDSASALNQDWTTIKARLIEDGSVAFELTQPLFDNDFPGHILRRIKRVSISLPVILGPYEDIRATLTQTYSAVQMKGGSLKENLRASQQVVLSGGVDDDGLFTFDFNDERYLPFEGTGAVSRWLLHFPNHQQQQPMLESLNDIIVHVRYTSKATS
ncbi:Tc toxin subunit A-related protein [Pseudomonas sp. H1_D04]